MSALGIGLRSDSTMPEQSLGVPKAWTEHIRAQPSWVGRHPNLFIGVAIGYLIGAIMHAVVACARTDLPHRTIDWGTQAGLETSVWAPLWPLMVLAHHVPGARVLVPFGDLYPW